MAAVDPALSRSYVDSFLGVPFDMGQVSWIATANEITSLSAALIDRFDIIELPGYSPEERLVIARQLLPKAIAASLFAEGVTVEIQEEALVLLATEYERGPGVRRLESAIGRVLRRAVMEQARGCRHILVGPNRLRDWLGAPHAATRVGFRPG
jgi:ATP-dependent Lon protease